MTNNRPLRDSGRSLTFVNLYVTLTGFTYRVTVASTGRIMGVFRKTKRGETSLEIQSPRAQRIITLALHAVAKKGLTAPS